MTPDQTFVPFAETKFLRLHPILHPLWRRCLGVPIQSAVIRTGAGFMGEDCPGEGLSEGSADQPSYFTTSLRLATGISL